jgi:hypothetical protein
MQTRTLDTPAGPVTIRSITIDAALEAFNAHPDGAGRIVRLIQDAAADPSATADDLYQRIAALHADVDQHHQGRLLAAGVEGNARALLRHPAMTPAALRSVCAAILDWHHAELEATTSRDQVEAAGAQGRAMCAEWLTTLRQPRAEL